MSVLEYSPVPPRRWRSTFLQAALLLSVFFLLVFNLDRAAPGAPLYQLFGVTSSRQASLDALRDVDQNFRSTAAGGNLLLHLPGYAVNDPTQSMRSSGLYFRANYVLFPHRAYVGDRPRVVNMADQLLAGDDQPSPAWMAAHDVRGVCIYPGPGYAPSSGGAVRP